MALKSIDSLNVYYGTNARKVSLLQGDITDLAAAEAVDYLVVSTLPSYYEPSSGAVIGALEKKGISVQKLSQNKEVNYIPEIPCWISKAIPGQNFKRLLIFEPENPKSTAADLVDYIFSATAYYEQNATKDIKMAVPLVCTGYSGASEEEVLEALFYAAVHRGTMKLPFREIKIVAYTDKQVASLSKLFSGLKNRYENLMNLTFSQEYIHYAKAAYEHIKNISPGDSLTKRQQFGICMYTSNYYSIINRILRENDKNSLEYKNHKPLFEATDSGLMNIVAYQKMTYRGESGMSQERINQHKPGADILNLAYTSTAYAKGGWYEKPFRFDIKSLTGCIVENLSMFSGEQEVLYVRGMIYTVKNVSKTSYYLFTCDDKYIKFRR